MMDNPYIHVSIMSFVGRLIGRESWIDGFVLVGADRERYFVEQRKIEQLWAHLQERYSYTHPPLGVIELSWEGDVLVVKINGCLDEGHSAELQQRIRDAEEAPAHVKRMQDTATRQNAAILGSIRYTLAEGGEIFFLVSTLKERW